jgi:hypothetical protein
MGRKINNDRLFITTGISHAISQSFQFTLMVKLTDMQTVSDWVTPLNGIYSAPSGQMKGIAMSKGPCPLLLIFGPLPFGRQAFRAFFSFTELV